MHTHTHTHTWSYQESTGGGVQESAGNVGSEDLDLSAAMGEAMPEVATMSGAQALLEPVSVSEAAKIAGMM